MASLDPTPTSSELTSYTAAPAHKLVTSIEEEFHQLAANWRSETTAFSSLRKKVNNANYLKIIEMGQAVLPLILKSMSAEPQHWFVALKSISGEDPVPHGANFYEAVDAWLAWGRAKSVASMENGKTSNIT